MSKKITVFFKCVILAFIMALPLLVSKAIKTDTDYKKEDNVVIIQYNKKHPDYISLAPNIHIIKEEVKEA